MRNSHFFLLFLGYQPDKLCLIHLLLLKSITQGPWLEKLNSNIQHFKLKTCDQSFLLTIIFRECNLTPKNQPNQIKLTSRETKKKKKKLF